MLNNIQEGKRHGHGWSEGVTKMGNESRPSNNGKPGLITEATESVSNSRDSRPAIAASERTLNGAILAAEISDSQEESREIFEHVYADDIHATAHGLEKTGGGRGRGPCAAREFPCSASRVRQD